METLASPQPAAQAPTMGVDDQFVAFRCGATDYGIPIMSVREIRSWQPTMPIPGRSPAARGVLDIRGTVVEVYDLGALLGGMPVEPAPGTVVLVLSLAGRLIGVLVDSVSDIIQAGPADLMPVPDDGSNRQGKVGSMVAREEGLIAILDLDKVLN